MYKALGNKILIAVLTCAVFLLFSFGLPEGGPKNDNINWVATKAGHIHIKTFTSDTILGSPNLAFVLHGDAPDIKPNGQYGLASIIAHTNKNTIGIGILRPGYSDPDSNTSDGMRGMAIGDNYTEDRIKAIAEVIQKLKKVYKPKNTILIGHSGGAAIAADIIALYPGLVNSAVLIGCPCYVSEWRTYRLHCPNSSPQWSTAVTSISPDQVADKINDTTKVVIISGDKDVMVPQLYSLNYYNYLQSKNKSVRFVNVMGEGHNILFHDSVLNSVSRLIKQ